MTFTTIEGGAGTPPEPDWAVLCFNEDEASRAHDEWQSVVEELRAAKALTVANGHAIKRLVTFRVIYDRVAEYVLSQGAVVPAKRTKVPSHSPYWTVLKQAAESIGAAETELGVAPTRRGRLVEVKAGRTKSRAADKYLALAKGGQ